MKVKGKLMVFKAMSLEETPTEVNAGKKGTGWSLGILPQLVVKTIRRKKQAD